jgi:uncharacterized membrane protein (UPF0127 family)
MDANFLSSVLGLMRGESAKPSISQDDYEALRELWVTGKVNDTVRTRLTDLKIKGFLRMGISGNPEVTDLGVKAMKEIVLACERSSFEGGGFDISKYGKKTAGGKRKNMRSASTENSGLKLKIEVASDDESRRIGLMGRKSMSKDSGMLFLFPKPTKLSFWMANTQMPLDLSFVDDEGKIGEIHEMTPHCTKQVASSKEYRMALETLQGVLSKSGFGVGSRLKVSGDTIEITKDDA